MPTDRIRPRRVPALVCAALAALLLAGCGEAGTGSAAGQAIPAGEYRLLEGAGPGGDVPVLEDAPITLLVDGERWHGVAACNSYGATVETQGNELTIRDLFQTEMGCLEEHVMEAERTYLDALHQVERHELAEDRLVLLGDGVELVYAEVPPEPDAALVGTIWVLTSLVDGDGPDGSVSSVVGEPTLEFRADGNLRGSTGCNELETEYEDRDGTLVTGEIVVNAAGCPDGLPTSQDDHVLAVLGDAQLTVSLDGRSLRLMGSDGRGLDYRATDAG